MSGDLSPPRPFPKLGLRPRPRTGALPQIPYRGFAPDPVPGLCPRSRTGALPQAPYRGFAPGPVPGLCPRPRTGALPQAPYRGFAPGPGRGRPSPDRGSAPEGLRPRPRTGGGSSQAPDGGFASDPELAGLRPRPRAGFAPSPGPGLAAIPRRFRRYDGRQLGPVHGGRLRRLRAGLDLGRAAASDPGPGGAVAGRGLSGGRRGPVALARGARLAAVVPDRTDGDRARPAEERTPRGGAAAVPAGR